MGLTNTTEGAVRKLTNTPHARDIMILALWFGLVAGLVEGSLFLIFQHLHWLAWSVRQWPVSSEIVWISSIFDLLLFAVVGLTLVVLGHCLPRLISLGGCLFIFVWLAGFDWLAISGRLRSYAALILAGGLASAAMRWFSRHEGSALQFARRSLPWILTAALLALVGIQGGLWLKERITTARLPATSLGSPNIVVIVVDTLRADHLSSYGYAQATSPNFDRIAKQGVLFESAYSASSWTLPSHASMLTGRPANQHGAGRPGYFYDGRYPTIAQSLSADGYRTAAFSANTIFFSRATGLAAGFLHFEDYFGSWADMASRTLYGRKFNQYLVFPLGYDIPGRKRAQDVNREFLRWADSVPTKHFFAFLNYIDTHDPYLPPQPYRSRFSGLKNPGGLINQFTSDILRHLTPEQIQGERDAYDGAINYVDERIGELFSGLKMRGLAENTLVVITSDHGEEFGDHGLLIHGKSLYQQEIHVPLVFWWPGKIPAGVRLKMPITNAALPATIMNLLTLGGQNQFPGPSLSELWKTPAPPPDWPEPQADLADLGSDMKSLITAQWQYIKHDKSGDEELYDWREDPQELHDLVATQEGQQINRELLVRLRARINENFGKREVDKQYQTQAPEPAGLSPAPASPRLH